MAPACSPGLFCSSIGRKFVMGLTGLALSAFVGLHMLENLLLFASDETYNRYAHALTSNPLIYIPEIGLLMIFLVHVLYAITLTIGNRLARPVGYAMGTNGEKAVSIASKTMIHTGMILLIFLGIHLFTIKFGPHYDIAYDGAEMRDLKKLAVEVFSNPLTVGGYTLVMLLLGFHLSHGVASCFQSLGFNHPSYTPKIKKLGLAYAVIVAAGFISEPLYIYFVLNR